jgi:hypothetical protein
VPYGFSAGPRTQQGPLPRLVVARRAPARCCLRPKDRRDAFLRVALRIRRPGGRHAPPHAALDGDLGHATIACGQQARTVAAVGFDAVVRDVGEAVPGRSFTRDVSHLVKGRCARCMRCFAHLAGHRHRRTEEPLSSVHMYAAPCLAALASTGVHVEACLTSSISAAQSTQRGVGGSRGARPTMGDFRGHLRRGACEQDNGDPASARPN